MAEEDPRETVRLDSPQTHWKTTRERKKAIEEERKAPGDEHEARGQNEDSPKQGLSTICQLCLSWKCSGKSPTLTSLLRDYIRAYIIQTPLCTYTDLFITWVAITETCLVTFANLLLPLLFIDIAQSSESS